VGFNAVFFHAAIRTVARGPHEAASLAGAGAWRRFWAITFPAIRPVTIFLIVLNTILAFRVFELPWILERGTPGPNKSGLFVVTHLYETGFVRGDLGYASAIGWAVTAVVVLLALGQHAIGGSWEVER
jgi:lactose/L-arabinose transport system permease protein